MGRVICFPAERKPTSSSNVQYWTPGGSIEYILPTFTRIDGSWTTSNGTGVGATTRGDRGGNAFASSTGFHCTVVTGTNNYFYTNTFIGNPGFGAYEGSYINGNNLVGSSVENSAQSSWILGVKGFICEVSDIPYPNDGSAASDNCGGCSQWKIAGVFVDTGGRIRVVEMTIAGTKITGHSWNQRPTSRNTWYTMSYYCNNTNDMLSWYHIGWMIEMEHKRFCGGKSKNCTGRIRYLQPLVSRDNGALYAGNVERWAVCGRGRTWSDRNNGAILVV